MSEEKNKNKRIPKWIWIVLGVIIIAGLFAGWRIWQNRQNMSQVLANLETEPYSRLTLNANIYGTGVVKPNQSAILTWSANGIVGEVNVSLGQAVNQGDRLMALASDSLAIDVLQAQIDVINAQNSLDALYESVESDLAQAKLDLIDAEDRLEDLQEMRNRMNFRRCTDERIEELEEDLENAEKLYDFNQNSENLQLVNTAQANLEYCRANFSERQIAEKDLEIALAEVRVADLKERVDLLSVGPDPDQVTIRETQLAIAESRLDSPFIEAPFDGIVSALPTQTGDVANIGSQALQLDNLSELFLEVRISEVDIPFLALGQKAELVFDAYFETPFTGEVIEISPVGTPVGGVVEYPVRIRMLDAGERIKPGMTAAVNIVVAEKDDVFVIPNYAIVSIDGRDHVYVQRNGSFESVSVSLGGYSDFYREVREADIEEGELIVLNPPDEITGEMPFGGPPEGSFGPFGN
mgnify:CR=1 FL=1